MSLASLLDNTRWENYQNLSGPLVETVLACTKRLAESSTLAEDEKRQSLLKIQKSVHAMIKLEATANSRRDASKRLIQVVQGGGDDLDIMEVYTREMRKAEQAAARTRVGKDGRAKKIADLLGDNGEQEDEEVQVAAESIPSNAKCPITFKPMTRPMKNRACGHVFSYDGAVMLLLQGNSRGNTSKTLEQIKAINPTKSIPCPIAGCPSKFGPDTLSRDFATERSQRLQSAIASTANGDEEGDEDMVID